MKINKLIYIAVLIMALLSTCAFSLDVNTGDSITIFENQVIPAGDIVSGDAVSVFGNLKIDGSVRGDVVVVFGNADLNGEVNGDIVAVFGNINVHENAVVGGDVAGVFGNVNREQGSIIRGDIVDTKGGFEHGNFDFMPNASFGTVIGMAFMYGLACLVVLIAPERVALMVQSSQHNIGRKFGIGILALFVLILLIPILIITIIGIIPAILLIFALMVVALMSTTAVYIALGRKIAQAVEGKNAVYIHLLIGLVVVNALQMLPFVGFLASMAVFFVGLGAAFDTRLGSPVIRKKEL